MTTRRTLTQRLLLNTVFALAAAPLLATGAFAPTALDDVMTCARP